jgi:hypothetical protein
MKKITVKLKPNHQETGKHGIMWCRKEQVSGQEEEEDEEKKKKANNLFQALGHAFCCSKFYFNYLFQKFWKH